jgi:hypothetical protein
MPDLSVYQFPSAAADDLTPTDYRQIYDELRQQRSLRQFVQLLASTYSIAWWSKYERDELRLTRAARNELRRAVNLPDLPPTVPELLADPAVVSPAAAVYRLDPRHSRADGNPVPASCVLLLADQPTDITIHLNSNISIVAQPSDRMVTEVTRTTHPAPRKTYHLCPATSKRFNTARQDAGYTVDEFVAALLDHWTET